MLARIQIRHVAIRAVLHALFIRLGKKHPQALMYSLSVSLKGPVAERKVAAESLLTSLKAHSNSLVEEALMVSSELSAATFRSATGPFSKTDNEYMSA